MPILALSFIFVNLCKSGIFFINRKKYGLIHIRFILSDISQSTEREVFELYEEITQNKIRITSTPLSTSN